MQLHRSYQFLRDHHRNRLTLLTAVRKDPALSLEDMMTTTEKIELA